MELGDQSNLGTLSSVSMEIAAVAKQAFYDFGERPTYTERVTYGSRLPNQYDIEEELQVKESH